TQHKVPFFFFFVYCFAFFFFLFFFILLNTLPSFFDLCAVSVFTGFSWFGFLKRFPFVYRNTIFCKFTTFYFSVVFLTHNIFFCFFVLGFAYFFFHSFSVLLHALRSVLNC